jgi:hypothetical protein
MLGIEFYGPRDNLANIGSKCAGFILVLTDDFPIGVIMRSLLDVNILSDFSELAGLTCKHQSATLASLLGFEQMCIE